MPATTQSPTNHIKRCKPLLGTYVEVSVLSENNNNDTLIDISECVFSEIQRVENLMSFLQRNRQKYYLQLIVLALVAHYQNLVGIQK